MHAHLVVSDKFHATELNPKDSEISTSWKHGKILLNTKLIIASYLIV